MIRLNARDDRTRHPGVWHPGSDPSGLSQPGSRARAIYIRSSWMCFATPTPPAARADRHYPEPASQLARFQWQCALRTAVLPAAASLPIARSDHFIIRGRADGCWISEVPSHRCNCRTFRRIGSQFLECRSHLRESAVPQQQMSSAQAPGSVNSSSVRLAIDLLRL